jgi:hypothetical protein
VVSCQQGFLIFKKEKLPTTFDDVSAVYFLGRGSTENAFVLYDVPVPNRIDFSFSPACLPGGGVVLSENNGPLWLLNDPTNLPSSLFDRSLPVDVVREAP